MAQNKKNSLEMLKNQGDGDTLASLMKLKNLLHQITVYKSVL